MPSFDHHMRAELSPTSDIGKCLDDLVGGEPGNGGRSSAGHKRSEEESESGDRSDEKLGGDCEGERGSTGLVRSSSCVSSSCGRCEYCAPRSDRSSPLTSYQIHHKAPPRLYQRGQLPVKLGP